MDALTIKNQNAMPAPTWGWLKMNDVDIRVPQGLARDCQVAIEDAGELLDNQVSFEGALAALQERLDEARADATEDARASVRAARTEDVGAADLDTPALSAYERRAVLSETAGDVAADFETGVGGDARAYLNMLAGGTAVLATEAGEHQTACVRVTAGAGTASGASLDVVAAEDSAIDLVVSLDARDARAAETAQAGLLGSTLRVFAGERSRVNVTVYLTADSGFTAIDDSGYVLDADARVSVRHVVVGGGFTATGLAADLRGDGARIDIDTSYLACGADVRDFNYTVRHRGRSTQCDIRANGVLTGTAKKTLRGTIDLVHGCKGSQGNERETVLLANQGVENKTVPVILCDEDDVAGNHGATIGHVRPEQTFYAACRGLSQEAVEALFLKAKLEDAALKAPDATVRANVVRLGERLAPDFEEAIA